QLERIFGLPPGGFDGAFETYCNLLHPDDRDEVLVEVGRAMEEKRSYEVRHKLQRPDGSVRWLEGLGRVVRGPDGEATGTMGCARDVTDRVLADRRLARLHAVTSELAGAWTIDEVIAIVREHGRDVVGADSGAIALPVRGGRGLRLTAETG